MSDKRDLAPSAPATCGHSTAGADVIDWTALESRYARRPQFVARLASVAVASTREVPTELRQLANTWRTADIAAVAHSVRTGADVVMAYGVRDLAARVESACRANASDAVELTLSLADALDQLLVALRKHLETAAR